MKRLDWIQRNPDTWTADIFTVSRSHAGRWKLTAVLAFRTSETFHPGLDVARDAAWEQHVARIREFTAQAPDAQG
ncbi:MAG: hypothetical protein DI533_00575 [Cereibacter sphaeroides]|uniref:Uncharacterized protein n=1 Tax=Cereibacter sphaeroides TaxID=1063 RepID=A0A2W5SIU6_CERSP|nr:MAG: hypothetical protein DI533_00575 [Cereibacter sphaeroides]